MYERPVEQRESLTMPTLIAEINIAGEAKPAGSKTGFKRKNGTVGVRDSNPNSRSWKDEVARRAAEAYEGAALDAAIMFEVVEYRVRPSSHYGSGRNAGIVKANAPAYPMTMPDLTKIVRGVEDALKSIVWVDDCRVVRLVASKDFGPQARVVLRVYLMDEQTAGELPLQDRLRNPSVVPPEQQSLLVA